MDLDLYLSFTNEYIMGPISLSSKYCIEKIVFSCTIDLPVVKLLFNLASNFFGSEIGLGILDLVMDVRRTKVLPEAPAAPLPASPAVVRSQK